MLVLVLVLVQAENLTLPSGEDPYLFVDSRDSFHLLYHRMNAGQQTGGHAYSVSGRTDTWNFGPPAYDATVRYEDPNIGRRWFASRERPHLVWAARRDGAPGREIVALTVSQY